MNATQLKNLLERVQAWPDAAQDELVAVANEIESELQARHYVATRDELQASVVRYPFRIFYRVRDDTIDILHIRHTSRRPPS